MHMEWGDSREKPCRPHEWTELEVGPEPEKVGPDVLAICRTCHVRRCVSVNESGRCMLAVHHPKGTHHRYPDLMSEPVGGYLEDPSKAKGRRLRRAKPDPPPEPA
jgi:hypothetical protein